MSSHATPSRPADRDRLPFPYSGTPQSHRSTSTSSSSTTPPTIQSSSSTNALSSSPNVKPTAAPISLSSLLAAHASAQNPHAAALDQALFERNQLSSQNSQLWKLIEKQRSGYNQMLKELERVRAERDSLRGRVSSGKEKVLKASVSNSAMSSSANGPVVASVDVRPLAVRHHSDDMVTPRNEHHNLSTHRSQDQQSQPSRSPNSQSQPKATPPPLMVPSRSESLPTPGASGSPDTPQASADSGLSTNGLIYPPVGLSPNPRPNPSSSNPNPSPNAGQPQYPQRRSSMIPPGTGTPPYPPTSTLPSIPNSTNNSSAYSSTSSLNDPSISIPPPTVIHPPAVSHPFSLQPGPSRIPGYSMQGPLPPPPLSTSALLSPVPESPHPHHHRESRISLPDEAKRYIATMGDSPAPSPVLGSGFPGQALHPQGQPSPAPSESVMLEPDSSVPPPPAPMTNPFEESEAGESEFLDMGQGDHDDENDGDEEGDDEDEDVDDEGPGSGNHQQQQSRTQVQQPPSTQPLATDGRSPGKAARAAVEDFPLPPGFGSSSGAHVPGPIQQGPLHAHVQAHAHAQAQALAHAQAQARAQGQGLEYQQPQRSRADPEISGPYSQSNLDSESYSSPYLPNAPSSSSSTSLMNSAQSQTLSLMSTSTTSPAFRALPLLATDLPQTRISVSHSSIRPNDRGKEVLSFIIVVDPGRGKETWNVEKLYSDVLGLDQRIRASVGKGVGKKIASLPEGKLWRDHAPAKVDQRKAALETYLQQLINLPVKNKDEVIAFFCSDVVRETKKPVYQAGYKEGYLTKRGKNFGGWKTRYFVLQGPVLEYYESRGGTHLGSITITGAQIGRQQRIGDRRESDDEKEYRHAFLIIEAKKGPSGSSARHVLCAESDNDRDNWVEVLVRYIMGSYNEDPNTSYGPSQAVPLTVNTNSSPTQPQGGISAAQPRSSTSSNGPLGDNPNGRRPLHRGMSKDDIAKGSAMPISKLAPDATNIKLFQAPSHEELGPSSPSKAMDPSPTDRQGTGGYSDSDHARRILDRGQPPLDVPLSSSLPTTSPLDAPTGLAGATNQRANSELGHYPDLQEQRDGRSGASPERPRLRDQYRERKSFHPKLNTVASTPNTPRPADQEAIADTPRADAYPKAKISGPLGGTVIPAGYKFGGKDAPAEPGPSIADRREKVKSRSFWGFGGKNASAEKYPPHVPRAVFGVTLEESLDVVEIANLPAVIFRCIQYLEAKKADQEEGIYRLSGSSAVIKSLKDRFNAEGDVDLLSSDEYWDPHAIAGLLKSFLRELPASILTRELHLRFLSVIDFVDPQERIQELSNLISSLPIANYSLLRALTAHLILIVQNAGVNKMTMRNVGIVFSPTLGIPAGVFSLMLGEFNRVFNVDGVDEDSQNQGENSSAAEDLSRRNSRQYTDAAADQLLGLSGRTLTTPVEEGQSDADSLSVDYESPESTEDSVTLESSARSSPGVDHLVNLETPATPKASKASHTAAARGLNIAVSNRGNRHSRMMGLPASPRHPNSPHPSHPVSVVPQTPK